MEYDRGDRFPFGFEPNEISFGSNFELNRIQFGSKSKLKPSLQSYYKFFSKNWKKMEVFYECSDLVVKMW